MSNYLEHKSKLEQMLLDVTSELETIAIKDTVTDDWVALPEIEEGGSDADENTNADNAEGLEERVAMTADLEHQYLNIKRALQKIANGTYGFCEISGEPIEEGRLLFKPDARTCTKHMNDEEGLSL